MLDIVLLFAEAGISGVFFLGYKFKKKLSMIHNLVMTL